MYHDTGYYLGREVVCRKLTEAVSTIISLPTNIQIRFVNLGYSVYGAANLEYRYRMRVDIHSVLTVTEIPSVLVHELIHMSQVHTGLLRAGRHGTCFWKEKPYLVSDPKLTDQATYLMLPWEQDVADRQADVLARALRYALESD